MITVGDFQRFFKETASGAVTVVNGDTGVSTTFFHAKIAEGVFGLSVKVADAAEEIYVLREVRGGHNFFMGSAPAEYEVVLVTPKMREQAEKSAAAPRSAPSSPMTPRGPCG